MLKQFIIFVLMFSFCNYSFSQFSSRKIINDDTSTLRAISTADFDNDGDQDIITSDSGLIAWYENIDGQGNFSESIPIQEGMGQSFDNTVADLDNDGYMDVIVSYFDEDVVGWYRNLGDGSFGTMNMIASNLNRSGGVTAKDIDSDGFVDLILGVTNGNGLYWVQNTDGLGTFSTLNVIDASYAQARLQRVGDIDGDGDMDILSNGSSPYLVWYENLDGAGTFGAQHVIEDASLYESSIQLVDLDGDGDLDTLSEKDDLVIWRENLDGQGTFGAIKIIASNLNGLAVVSFADIDSDGDLDVFSVASQDDTIAWYENLDGDGDFGPQQIIDANLISPRTVHPADLDGGRYGCTLLRAGSK